MQLNALLRKLQDTGCYPSVTYMGLGQWRASIGIYLHYESNTPLKAALGAYKKWVKNGMKVGDRNA